jgi:predicted dehydrogenase
MKIRTMLIGLGYMGSIWAKVLREAPDYETVAYVDSSAERRGVLRDELALETFPGFSSVQDVIRSVAVDAAVIATPAFTHHDVCMEVLAHGLPVLVEKPLETDWAKAQNMVAEAQRRGLLLLVDQNYRWTAPFRTMKRAIQEGGLGAPGFATVIHHRNRPGAGTYQQNMPHPMLLDMSTHHFDCMRYLFGREAVSVQAHFFNPAWSDYAGPANVDLVIEFEQELWVTYSGSNAARGASIHPFGNWRVECEKGGLYLESQGFDLELYRVPLGAAPKYKEVMALDLMPRQNQACLLEEFRDGLRYGREAETSGRDNLRTLAIAMAAIESQQRGQRVPLCEFLPA